MKKILYLFILFYSMNSLAQFSLTPSLGYLFNGKIQFEEGVVDIGNTSSFGLSLGHTLSNTIDGEIEYIWMSKTQFTFTPANPQELQGGETEVNSHFILLNAISYLSNRDRFKPFICLGAGTTIFNIKNVSTAYRFTANIGIGARWKFTNLLSLRIQSRGIFPFHFIGSGLYAGEGANGSNAGYTLNAAVPFPIADISAGLVIAF